MQSTGCHLLNERCHPCFRFLPEQAALFVLLLIDVQAVVPIDRADQRGLNTADTLLGEKAFFRVCGEDHHVNMDVLLLFMESGIPAQATRVDLIALGDVRDGGVDEILPVFKVSIAQTLRILTGEGDDRRPHIHCVLRYLGNRILQRQNLPVGVPQAVFAH